MKGSHGRGVEGGGEGEDPSAFTAERQPESFSLKAPFAPGSLPLGKAICPGERCATYTLADPTDWQKKDSGSLRFSDEVNAGRKGQGGKQAAILSFSFFLSFSRANRETGFPVSSISRSRSCVDTEFHSYPISFNREDKVIRLTGR